MGRAVYDIESADPLEWGAWASLYRRPDEHFRSPEELLSLGCGEPCVWALLGGERAGGAVAGAGAVAYPFALPGAHRASLIAAFTRYARALASPGADLEAPAVRWGDAADFVAAGWRPREEPGDGLVWCRAMARPPQRMEIPPPEGYRLARPRRTDAKACGGLLAEAYEGVDPLRPDAAYFAGDYLDALSAMDPLCRRASSIAWRDGAPAGLALISRYAGRPVVWDIAVDARHRGRGIARALLAAALSELVGQEDILRLFVRADNPAVALYEGMGFAAGEMTCDMRLPAGDAGA